MKAKGTGTVSSEDEQIVGMDHTLPIVRTLTSREANGKWNKAPKDPGDKGESRFIFQNPQSPSQVYVRFYQGLQTDENKYRRSSLRPLQRNLVWASHLQSQRRPRIRYNLQ
jgi:hypothetical protein